MKKSFLLVLIFVGYQFMFALLLILVNYLLGRPDPNTLDLDLLILSSILSNAFVIGHLLLCRDARLDRASFTGVPVRCYLLCLPLMLSAMFVLNVLSEWMDLPDLNQEMFLQMAHNPFGVLSIVVMAPFAEELLFRGAIERHLLKQGHSAAFAIVLSSAFFGVVHGNPIQIPFAFALGTLLAWIYYRTCSLVPCILCHMLNNSLSVWSIVHNPVEMSTEEMMGGPVVLYVTLLLCVALFVVCFVWARRVFPRRR